MLALPMPFRGVAGAFEDAGTWTMGMVLRYDAGGIAQRPERGFGHKNQSLMALANRLLRAIPADGEARDGWKVNVADLDFATVNKIIAALGPGPGRALRRPDAEEGRTAPGTSSSIEYALLILLILMFSPLSFNYFVRLAALPADRWRCTWGWSRPGARPAGGSCSARWPASLGPAGALAGLVADGGGLRQLVLRRGDPAGRPGLEARPSSRAPARRSRSGPAGSPGPGPTGLGRPPTARPRPDPRPATRSRLDRPGRRLGRDIDGSPDARSPGFRMPMGRPALVDSPRALSTIVSKRPAVRRSDGSRS